MTNTYSQQPQSAWRQRLSRRLLTALLPLAASYSALAATVPLVNGRAEAEMGTLGGVTLATTPAGYSGSGFVTSFDEATDNVSITFDNPTAGLYKLGIGYTSPFGPKGYNLKVNSLTSEGTKSSASYPMSMRTTSKPNQSRQRK